MKYRYTPNCHIIDYENNRTKFKFDENGEFETDDPTLNDWIRKNKNFLKPEPEAAATAAAGATPPMADMGTAGTASEGTAAQEGTDANGAGNDPENAISAVTATEETPAAAGVPLQSPDGTSSPKGALDVGNDAGTQEPEDVKTFRCKKCNFVGKSIQEMGAHSRTAHPKPKTEKAGK